MRNVLRPAMVFLSLVNLSLPMVAEAKSLKDRFGVTQNGHMSKNDRQELSNEVQWANNNMSQEQYERVVANPEAARNEQERLAGLSAREIFILVDRSGSMTAKDDCPIGNHMSRDGWTRWDSARVAAESIAEVSLSLDADNRVEVMLWSGDRGGRLDAVDEIMTNVSDITRYFQAYQPNGTTPLKEALDNIYQKRLKGLLQKNEPFTVVVLTDGAPNDPNGVRQFFKKVIRENDLERPGRETLAAFSFVRMGDDPGAINFLQDLDDNLIQQLGVKVDIVDTKEDNFLFGTGTFQGQAGVGPFALMWDAIYD